MTENPPPPGGDGPDSGTGYPPYPSGTGGPAPGSPTPGQFDPRSSAQYGQTPGSQYGQAPGNEYDPYGQPPGGQHAPPAVSTAHRAVNTGTGHHRAGVTSHPDTLAVLRRTRAAGSRRGRSSALAMR